MASVKRRCATCRYFQDSEMSGRGWCTHPDRQVSSDIRILVRAAELACRNAWGSDLWTDARETDAPEAPATPRQPQLPEPQPITAMYDDEVTSVVSADASSACALALEDDIVQQSGIVDDDQDERLNLLRRDSRSAIERARLRARQRRAPQEAPEPEHVAEPAPAAPDMTREFAPDDFVEEETAAASPTIAMDDDGVVLETLRAASPRSRRLRRSGLESASDPKGQSAATKSDEDEATVAAVPAHSATDLNRFAAVPERDASIDLPMRGDTPTVEPRADIVTETDKSPSVYERALRRAHQIRVSSRLQADHHAREITVPLAEAELPDIEDQPAPPAFDESRGAPSRIRTQRTISTPGSAPSEDPSRTERSRTIPSHNDREMRIANIDHEKRTTRITSRSEQQDATPHPVSSEARSSWWRGNRPEQKRAEHIRAHDQHLQETVARAVAMATSTPALATEPEHYLENPEPFELPSRGEDTSSGTRPITRNRLDGPQHGIARDEQAPRLDEEPLSYLDDDDDSIFETPLSDLTGDQRVSVLDLRDAIHEAESFSVPTVELAPDVPRACATCRSYRASEQAGRGWCTNEWAFDHRQMVNESELPCGSTLGCWWLPADRDVWDEEIEPVASSTARVDRMLARRSQSATERRRRASGE